jgi:type I restriction enzyme S subunit
VSELPGGWEFKSLGEVAKWGSGGTPKATRSDFYGGSIPWAVIGDLSDGVITDTEKHITPEALSESSAKLVPVGSILVAMYGSIGKLGIAGVEMTTNQAIAFAVPDESVVLQKYLYWFLAGERDLFLKSGKGMTQQNISQTILKAWEIPVPPLDVQERIVETLEDHLSRLDKARRLIDVALKQVQTLRGSCLNDLFATGGGSEAHPVQLKDLVDFRGGYSYKSSEWKKTGVAVIKIANIQRDVFSWDKVDFVSTESAAGTMEFAVNKGDLIQTLTGELLGASAIYDRDEPARLNQRLVRISISNGINLDLAFLHGFLQAPRIRQILRSKSKGAAQPNVSVKDVGQLELALYKPSEQKERLGQWELMSTSVSDLESDLLVAFSQLETLRRSLLHAAFTGQLTNEDSND